MFKFSSPLNHSIFLIIGLSFLICACDKPAFLPAQCSDSIGCVDIPPGAPLKIGVIQALSGKVVSIGEDQVRGIELALDDRQGLLAKHAVYFQIEDSGCSAEGGANAALKIVADPDHIAILGTTCSGAAATASKIMTNSGLSMISGNNSAAFLTTIADKRAINWQSGFFRTAPNEENAGKTAALYAFNKLKLRKAATINDGDIYTQGLTDGFIKAFTDLGGEVVLDTMINKGDKEMQPVLTAVLNSQAELVFFPLFQPEGNYILNQAREMPKLKKITLISGGALIDSSFIADVGNNGNGMYFVGPALITGVENSLPAIKYQQKYGTKPLTQYYLSAYDAANLLFNAIEKTAITDPDGTLHIGRQRLRETLYATKDFQGISGNLNCNKFGDCATPVFNVLRLDNHDAGISGLQKNSVFTYSPMNITP